MKRDESRAPGHNENCGCVTLGQIILTNLLPSRGLWLDLPANSAQASRCMRTLRLLEVQLTEKPANIVSSGQKGLRVNG